MDKTSTRELWSTSAVAAALRVGVSSVKRWTDEGALKSVKTLGGHRRYDVSDVRDFALSRGFETVLLPPPPEPLVGEPPLDTAALRSLLLGALAEGEQAAARAIMNQGARHGLTRAEFLDEVVAPVLETIGHEWRGGTWSVGSEHRASYIVAEILDRLRPDAIPADAPRAVLACPPGDLHDLPLRMVRLVLEWNDWHVTYLGADVPFAATGEAVRREQPQLLLLTSRSADPFATAAFFDLAAEFTKLGVRVGIGGWWARGGSRRDDGLLRFRTLRGFERWLHSSDAQSLITRSTI